VWANLKVPSRDVGVAGMRVYQSADVTQCVVGDVRHRDGRRFHRRPTKQQHGNGTAHTPTRHTPSTKDSSRLGASCCRQ